MFEHICSQSARGQNVFSQNFQAIMSLQPQTMTLEALTVSLDALSTWLQRAASQGPHITRTVRVYLLVEVLWE